MKRIFFAKCGALGCAVAVLLSALAFTSCVPDGGDEFKNSNGGGSPTENPKLPDGVKQISLFKGLGGGDLVGLYYNEDGFLISSNGWMLSSLGNVSDITKVDYIPRYDWRNQIYAELGLGFVGYHPTQGFVAFLIASMALDEDRTPVGVGLLYLPNFNGGDDAIELNASSLDFDGEGGSQTVELKGTKYAVYQTSFSGDWLTVTKKSTSVEFIKDLIEVTVSPNPTDEPRTTTIMIGTEKGKGTPLKITQKANKE